MATVQHQFTSYGTCAAAWFAVGGLTTHGSFSRTPFQASYASPSAAGDARECWWHECGFAGEYSPSFRDRYFFSFKTPPCETGMWCSSLLWGLCNQSLHCANDVLLHASLCIFVIHLLLVAAFSFSLCLLFQSSCAHDWLRECGTHKSNGRVHKPYCLFYGVSNQRTASTCVLFFGHA